MTPACRQDVVTEAMAWLGTPYHHMGNIRGAGVDCAMLLVEVYKALHLVPTDLDPRPYPHDWHLHRSEEVYLAWLDRYAELLPDPAQAEPGDVVAFQFGRCISHAAIVVKWPLVIHAYLENRSVIMTDIEKSEALMQRLKCAYRVGV